MASNKLGIDTEALIAQYEQATNQQSQALRKAVHEATLKALQQRELTLKAVRDVVRTVTESAAAGAARNVQGVEAASTWCRCRCCCRCHCRRCCSPFLLRSCLTPVGPPIFPTCAGAPPLAECDAVRQRGASRRSSHDSLLPL